jgi:hypothetical protein
MTPVAQSINHYRTLGISPSADEDEIKRAYRALAKMYHPDRVPAERRDQARTEMARINVAYEVLSDPVRRAQYDWQQGYAFATARPQASAVVPRRRAQRVRERTRRGQIERHHVVTLTGAALLGIALLAALVRLRLLGLGTTAGRCAWAIVLGVGTLLVLAALRLTEL